MAGLLASLLPGAVKGIGGLVKGLASGKGFGESLKEGASEALGGIMGSPEPKAPLPGAAPAHLAQMPPIQSKYANDYACPTKEEVLAVNSLPTERREVVSKDGMEMRDVPDLSQVQRVQERKQAAGIDEREVPVDRFVLVKSDGSINMDEINAFSKTGLISAISYVEDRLPKSPVERGKIEELVGQFEQKYDIDHVKELNDSENEAKYNAIPESELRTLALNVLNVVKNRLAGVPVRFD